MLNTDWKTQKRTEKILRERLLSIQSFKGLLPDTELAEDVGQ